ncbi:NAD+ synthase [Coralloluteibacterium thermophilus]|uniref:Glutamine-dependent NAD(+) synthetase n=1 Tax=Coralloluteibacterium thermophilum TaxID=2707049 RepID=A0ABV9NIG3_9GAMM
MAKTDGARLRIALAQFDFPVGAVRGNVERIRALIAEARDVHGADVVVFPELALCGYPPEDLLTRPRFLADCAEAIEAVAAEARGIVAVVGWPEAVGSALYNAASVLRDGRIERTYRKRELPNYAVFDEKRHFACGGETCVFDVNGVAVGLLVCEDLWYGEHVAETVAAGAELLLVPNASPYERDKHRRRAEVVCSRSREAGVPMAYLNLVGGQDELMFDGASLLIDHDGHLHPAARAFEDHWLVADLDADGKRFVRVAWPEEDDESFESLAYRGIVRGTRDYLHKNGFRQALLGLSGGIDSSLVLAIAADAIGGENVTAVRLPSRYTAELSNALADEQARALGVKLLTVPIEKPHQGFLDALAPLLAGTEPDVTEENLQSRTRGAILMALSNKFGGMLLTTGNKSEYAVGYATIYGDMAGGYAPIKDLYKTEVYALSRWRNAKGEVDAIPVGVIERAPSAELRENQTDQDSLPPYDDLDAILLAHVDEALSREEIVARGHDAGTVDRVIRLVRISEWKRRQSAPGPKISRRAFGRERRYPITNGWREG